MNRDSFARSSAARAWQAAREANTAIEVLLARLERIENAMGRPAEQYRRCPWCGEWSIGPACRSHIDLMSTTDSLEEALGA